MASCRERIACRPQRLSESPESDRAPTRGRDRGAGASRIFARANHLHGMRPYRPHVLLSDAHARDHHGNHNVLGACRPDEVREMQAQALGRRGASRAPSRRGGHACSEEAASRQPLMPVRPRAMPTRRVFGELRFRSRATIEQHLHVLEAGKDSVYLIGLQYPHAQLYVRKHDIGRA
jgi:hypothetical protein